MRKLQPFGVLLIVAGVIVLYLLRAPLVSLMLLVLEFLAIVIALILVIAGIALLVGGPLVRRRFRMRL